jgi:hypothetical protein
LRAKEHGFTLFRTIFGNIFCLGFFAEMASEVESMNVMNTLIQIKISNEDIVSGNFYYICGMEKVKK